MSRLSSPKADFLHNFLVAVGVHPEAEDPDSLAPLKSTNGTQDRLFSPNLSSLILNPISPGFHNKHMVDLMLAGQLQNSESAGNTSTVVTSDLKAHRLNISRPDNFV